MPLKRAGDNVQGEWLSVVPRPPELNCLRIKEHPACEAVRGFWVSANVLRPALTGMFPLEVANQVSPAGFAMVVPANNEPLLLSKDATIGFESASCIRPKSPLRSASVF